MQTQINQAKFKGTPLTQDKMGEILKSDLHNLSGLIYLLLKEETVLKALAQALWEVHQRDEARKEKELQDEAPDVVPATNEDE